MKKKFSFTILFFIVGVILAGIISTKAFQEAYRSRKIEKEVEDLKADAKRVQNENDDLAAKIAYLQTPEFQEKVAKEKLNLQKPGENVVVVKTSPQQEKKQINTVVVENASENELPNYQKWWNYFFKY